MASGHPWTSADVFGRQHPVRGVYVCCLWGWKVEVAADGEAAIAGPRCHTASGKAAVKGGPLGPAEGSPKGDLDGRATDATVSTSPAAHRGGMRYTSETPERAVARASPLTRVLCSATPRVVALGGGDRELGEVGEVGAESVQGPA